MTSSPPLAASTLRSLARGADLFDRGLYWESHEAWEEAWLEEEGQVRIYLQGLIQVAAGFHKAAVQHQARGCVRLLEAGLSKLRSVEGVIGGPLSGFIPAVERSLAEARRWLAGDIRGLEAETIPKLHLQDPPTRG